MYINMPHGLIFISISSLLLVSSFATITTEDHQTGDRKMLISLPPPGSKYTVRISNGLANGVWINVHCKSKDHDQGNRNLAPNQSFDIAFDRNYWRSNDFFCHVTWTWPGNEQSHWFDAYDPDRDYDWCKLGQVCCWTTKASQTCDCNDNTRCFPWNTQS